MIKYNSKYIQDTMQNTAENGIQIAIKYTAVRKTAFNNNKH